MPFLIDFELKMGQTAISLNAVSRKWHDSHTKMTKSLDDLNNALNKGHKIARIESRINLHSERFKALEVVFNDFSNDFRVGENGVFGQAILKAMQVVKKNVQARFDSFGPGEVTGQLTRAIESEEPIVEQDSLTGNIIGRLMDTDALHSGTEPYLLIIKDGSVVGYKPRKSNKNYSYDTRAGTTIGTGYWPFHEFGAKTSTARHWILASRVGIHGEDTIIIDAVRDKIREQVDKFRAKAQAAIGG